MAEHIIQPKRPRDPGWRQLAGTLPGFADVAHTVWAHDANRIGVISAVEVAAEAPGMPPLGPAYHVSVSRFGERCTSGDALWVLAQFDLLDAKEDNHVPSGKVRNFWRYVADDLSGHQCACVEVEPAIREDRGDYVWRGA
jgi:hypothetical protein